MSQVDFKAYKQAVLDRERKVDEEHQRKITELKTQVMDIKAGFDNRVVEFKKHVYREVLKKFELHLNPK